MSEQMASELRETACSKKREIRFVSQVGDERTRQGGGH